MGSEGHEGRAGDVMQNALVENASSKRGCKLPSGRLSRSAAAESVRQAKRTPTVASFSRRAELFTCEAFMPGSEISVRPSAIALAPRIFISYRRSELECVRHMAQALHDAGADVFIDVEQVEPLSNFPERLRAAIADSHAVVVESRPDTICSPHDPALRGGIRSSASVQVPAR